MESNPSQLHLYKLKASKDAILMYYFPTLLAAAPFFFSFNFRLASHNPVTFWSLLDLEQYKLINQDCNIQPSYEEATSFSRQ